MESRLVWTDDENFTLDGVRYAAMNAAMNPRPEPDQLFIFKSKPAIEQYERFVQLTTPKTVVELGIWAGGSTALLAQLAAPAKLVAMDIKPVRNRPLDAFIASHGLGDVVSAYYGVDQADASRLAEIVAHEFDGTAIDLVIDDASHLIDETRASFNALFPYVRPDGLYIVEDWAWPHRRFAHPNPRYRSVTPISAFALELSLVAACDEGVIADVTFQRELAIVRRGPRELDAAGFDLASFLDPVGTEMLIALASTHTRS
jgi:predicted O-methyltransferase YrrM